MQDALIANLQLRARILGYPFSHVNEGCHHGDSSFNDNISILLDVPSSVKLPALAAEDMHEFISNCYYSLQYAPSLKFFKRFKSDMDGISLTILKKKNPRIHSYYNQKIHYYYNQKTSQCVFLTLCTLGFVFILLLMNFCFY